MTETAPDVSATRDAAAALVAQLVTARKARGTSQVGLARRLGVSEHSVQEWEAGLALPMVAHVIGWGRMVRYRLVLSDVAGVPVACQMEREADETWESWNVRRMGIRLRDQRVRWDLTQMRVAETAGVSRIGVLHCEARGRDGSACSSRW